MRTRLASRIVLIVEDEPLIAFDLAQAFEQVDATPLCVPSLSEAIQLVGVGAVSAAVVDFRLTDGNAVALCGYLADRGIPFVVYTGYLDAEENCRGAVVIRKPASCEQVVNALAQAFGDRASPSPSAVHRLLRQALLLQGTDKGNVQLLNPDDTLEIVSHAGFNEHFLRAFRTVHATDGCACGRALRERRAIVIPDIRLDKDFASYIGVAEEAGFRAVQSTPMISASGALVGVISTHYSHPHAPSEDDLRRLASHARQFADELTGHARA